MSRAIILPNQVGKHIASDNATALVSRQGVINETGRSEEYHTRAANKANVLSGASRMLALLATAAAFGANAIGAEKLRNGATALAIAAGATSLGSFYVGEANSAVAQAHTDHLHELGVVMTGVELANTSTAPNTSTVLPIQ